VDAPAAEEDVQQKYYGASSDHSKQITANSHP
jgi:hypothetical protein